MNWVFELDESSTYMLFRHNETGEILTEGFPGQFWFSGVLFDAPMSWRRQGTAGEPSGEWAAAEAQEQELIDEIRFVDS